MTSEDVQTLHCVVVVVSDGVAVAVEAECGRSHTYYAETGTDAETSAAIMQLF